MPMAAILHDRAGEHRDPEGSGRLAHARRFRGAARPRERRSPTPPRASYGASRIRVRQRDRDPGTCGDESLIVNMSVWESIDALWDFVYSDEHLAVMRRRREWFERDGGLHVPVVGRGRPPPDRRRGRGAAASPCASTGPTPRAFTFKRRFDRLPTQRAVGRALTSHRCLPRPSQGKSASASSARGSATSRACGACSRPRSTSPACACPGATAWSSAAATSASRRSRACSPATPT